MKQLSFEHETMPARRTRAEDIARIFCLAAAMALSMSGCGGGGGLPNMPDSGAGDDGGLPNMPDSGAGDDGGLPNMPDSQTPPPAPPPSASLYGIPSALAEAAARSVPALGSVTQSINVSSGMTQDRAGLVHAADGNLILRVSRGSGAWEMSTGGGKFALLQHASYFENGRLLPGSRQQIFVLRNRAESTIALMYTSKQANLVPATDADVFRQGEAVDEPYRSYYYLDDGAHDYDGPDTQSEFCVSDTGQCTVEDGRVTEGTLYLKEGAPAAHVQSWDTAHTDYLTLGMWLRPQSTAGSRPPEFGVFADGGRPFSESEFTTLTGTATYAAGAFASGYALGNSKDADAAPFLVPHDDGEHYPQLDGSVELTADFGNRTIDGTITLSHDDYPPGDPAAPEPIVLNLGSAPIDVTEPGGFFTGDTASDESSSVSGLSGKWGGQFYGVPADGGRPPHVGGTFGAQREGFSVLGVFLARDGADVNDDFQQPGPAAE